MSIDLAIEELITLKEAARMSAFLNPKTRKPAHVASLFRYVKVGARAADGSRVKLEVVKTPSGLRTSKESVWRFLERLTNGGGDAATRTHRQREKEIQRAEASLAAAGV